MQHIVLMKTERKKSKLSEEPSPYLSTFLIPSDLIGQKIKGKKKKIREMCCIMCCKHTLAIFQLSYTHRTLMKMNDK